MPSGSFGPVTRFSMRTLCWSPARLLSEYSRYSKDGFVALLRGLDHAIRSRTDSESGLQTTLARACDKPRPANCQARLIHAASQYRIGRKKKAG